MKRTFVIILVFQTLLLLMFLVYAMVQRTNAIKQQEIAVQNEKIAVMKAEELEEVKKKLVECSSASAVSK
jgi:hypothetical protein